MAPLILNLGTVGTSGQIYAWLLHSWGGEILQYSLNGRLSGPENWSGRCGEEISVVAPTKYQTMIPQTVLNDFLHQGQDMEF